MYFLSKKKVICGIENFMTILDTCFEYTNYSFHIKLYKWLPERIRLHKWSVISTFFSCGNCCLLLMVKIMLMSLFSSEFKTNSFHCPMKMCVGWFSYQSAVKEGMVITAYLFNLLLRMLYKHIQRHLCWEILFD